MLGQSVVFLKLQRRHTFSLIRGKESESSERVGNLPKATRGRAGNNPSSIGFIHLKGNLRGGTGIPVQS